MELPLSKKEQLDEITAAINLVNTVRAELIHYYPDMKENPVYKTNCMIDHDRLQKAMTKLSRVETEITYELKNLHRPKV